MAKKLPPFLQKNLAKREMADEAMDKKRGIKEMSAQDRKMDKKAGLGALVRAKKT